MSSYTRVRVLILIFCVGVLSGFASSSRGGTIETQDTITDDQTQYAEFATTSVQTFSPNSASSVTANVPILVYHIVRPSYPSDDEAVRTLALTPETFDAEMKYLQDAGYHVVSFRNLERYVQNGIPLPQKPIILSFDDGWTDQFEYAFPILKKYHYTATFFVFTNKIGHRGFLTWDNLQTLRDAGMTIGSHSRSHPFLNKINDPSALWDEIHGSKEVLEKRLSIHVHEFAYPFGAYNATVTALVQKAGYLSARGDFESKKQFAEHLYELGALNAPTTTTLFMRKF